MSDLVGTKGGSGVWQRIISEMPAHEVYIEPFWGRGTIAKKKRPAWYTIGCDLDPAAEKSAAGSADLFFRTDGIQWLADYFRLPRPEDSAALQPSTLPPDPAARSSQAALTAGTGDGRPPHNPAIRPGGCSSPAAESDVAIACTFGGVPWECHFVYLDPPYLGVRNYYKHNLTPDDHRRLCRLFLRLPCPAALSGYRSELYAEELRDTREIVIPTVNRAGARVDEIVWLNYEPPARYHDTRFVGLGRRERERIRRRVATWSAGLRRMPPAERQAVYEACAARYRGLAGLDAETGGVTR